MSAAARPHSSRMGRKVLVISGRPILFTLIPCPHEGGTYSGSHDAPDEISSGTSDAGHGSSGSQKAAGGYAWWLLVPSLYQTDMGSGRSNSSGLGSCCRGKIVV